MLQEKLMDGLDVSITDYQTFSHDSIPSLTNKVPLERVLSWNADEVSFQPTMPLSCWLKLRILLAWLSLTQVRVLVTVAVALFQLTQYPTSVFDYDISAMSIMHLSEAIQNYRQVVSVCSIIKFVFCLLQWAFMYERLLSFDFGVLFLGKPNLKIVRQPWFPSAFFFVHYLRRFCSTAQFLSLVIEYGFFDFDKEKLWDKTPLMMIIVDLVLLFETLWDTVPIIWTCGHVLCYFICLLLSLCNVNGAFAVSVKIFYNNPLSNSNLANTLYVSFLYFLQINFNENVEPKFPSLRELYDFYYQNNLLLEAVVDLANAEVLDDNIGVHDLNSSVPSSPRPGRANSRTSLVAGQSTETGSNSNEFDDSEIKNMFFRKILVALSMLPPYLLHSTACERIFGLLTSDTTYPFFYNYLSKLPADKITRVSPLVLSEIIVRRYMFVTDKSLSALFPISALFDSEVQFSELVAFVTCKTPAKFSSIQARTLQIISSLYPPIFEKESLIHSKDDNFSFKELLNHPVLFSMSDLVLPFYQKMRIFGHKLNIFVAWISLLNIVYLFEGTIHFLVALASFADVFQSSQGSFIGLFLSAFGAIINLRPIFFPSDRFLKPVVSCGDKTFEVSTLVGATIANTSVETIAKSIRGDRSNSCEKSDSFKVKSVRDDRAASVENLRPKSRKVFKVPIVTKSAIGTSGVLPTPAVATVPNTDTVNDDVDLSGGPNYPLFWEDSVLDPNSLDRYSLVANKKVTISNIDDNVSCNDGYCETVGNFLTTGVIPSFLVRCSPPSESIVHQRFGSRGITPKSSFVTSENRYTKPIQHPIPSYAASLVADSMPELPLMMLYPTSVVPKQTLGNNIDLDIYTTSASESFSFSVPFSDDLRLISLVHVMLCFYYGFLNRGNVYLVTMNFNFRIAISTLQFLLVIKTLIFLIAYFFILAVWIVVQFFSWTCHFEDDTFNPDLSFSNLDFEPGLFSRISNYLIFDLLPRISIFSPSSATRKCAAVISKWPTFEECWRFAQVSLRSDGSNGNKLYDTPTTTNRIFFSRKNPISVFPVALHHPWKESAVKHKLRNSIEQVISFLKRREGKSVDEIRELIDESDVSSADFILNNMEVLFVSNYFKSAVYQNPAFCLALAERLV